MTSDHRDVPPPPPPPIPDERARLEGGRDLDHESLTNEHTRSERIRDWVSRCGLLILIVIVVLIVAAIVSLGVQYLSPWGWLDEQQLKDVRSFLVSGAVISFASAYFRKYLSSK